jgi:hypothetical protein
MQSNRIIDHDAEELYQCQKSKNMDKIDKIMGQVTTVKLKHSLGILGIKAALSNATAAEKSEINKEIQECNQYCDVLDKEIKFLQNHYNNSN